jgi:hypothetical protein
MIVIREAIARGVLKRDDAVQMAASAGCNTGESGTCGKVLASIRNSPDAPATRETTRSAQAREHLEAGRARLLADPMHGRANRRGVQSYIEALVETEENDIAAVLRLLLADSPEDLPQEEQPAIRALATIGTLRDGAPRFEMGLLLGPASDLLRSRLRKSKGDEPTVRAVREVPGDLLEAVKAKDAKRREQYLASDLVCTISTWRAGEIRPNQWRAWREMLDCLGGW